jgi:hypothetical protein
MAVIHVASIGIRLGYAVSGGVARNTMRIVENLA